MSEHIIRAGGGYPDLKSGDVWTFEDGEHGPLPVIRNVTEFTLRAANPGKARLTSGSRPDGEDETGIRVMDGCHRTSIIGFDVSGCYHGIRVTGSEHCRILHCTAHDNEQEGILCGAVPGLEIGWCESFGNGGGDNDRAHGIYAPSWNTDGAALHDLYCHSNSGSGIQCNGTAEIQGTIRNLHAWNIRLEGNGVEGTPNLSLIGVQGARLRNVRTKGGRGGCRLFADGGKPCVDNLFFACVFDQAGTSFSVDSQERTRGTRLDPACVVTGPAMTASGGAQVPETNAAIT